MHQLIKAFGDSMVGVASSFDRIVFQGKIRPFLCSVGAMVFFRSRDMLFRGEPV